MAKILVIDDDLALSAIYEATFKKAGFDVKVAQDGKTGLETAASFQPDLILLDQIMPDMKGNEVLAKLKEKEETKNIPVALLSNFGQNEIVKEAITEGATDYILKYQVEPEDLVKKANEILAEVKNKAAQPAA